jgi:hypothetical protein
MAIDVFWQTEQGDVIEKWSDGHDTVGHLMYEHDTSGTCCLRFVDPYGNASFNHKQVPELISDLESVLGRHEGCEEKAKVESLIAFLKKTEGSKAHIGFYGD